MHSPSPYGPDLSLPIAAVVLIGGGLLAAGAVYLLMMSAENLTDWHRARLAKVQAKKQARSAARRPVRRASPPARSRLSSEVPGAARSLAPGRVPTWAGSGNPVPPSRPPVQGTYDLRADMSHADLGPPPDGPRLGMVGAGMDRAEGESPVGGVPDAGGAPLTADLGTESSSEATAWRSDASRLGRRARALSGALAHLDRSRSSTSGRTRTSGMSNPASGDASTTSTGGGSRATADPPDPPDEPPQVPVDGGLGWLAAAGAAYAANRLRKQQDAGESDDEA